MEDRVRGVQYRGLLFYMKDLNLTKIRAHIKYVYVRPQILSLEKREDDKTIRVEWRHVGLTTLRMGLRYIPDKLWYRTNMDKAARVWSEGTSTYHIDEDFKIYRIVVEKPMEKPVESDKESAKPSNVALQQKF